MAFDHNKPYCLRDGRTCHILSMNYLPFLGQSEQILALVTNPDGTQFTITLNKNGFQREGVKSDLDIVNRDECKPRIRFVNLYKDRIASQYRMTYKDAVRASTEGLIAILECTFLGGRLIDVEIADPSDEED